MTDAIVATGLNKAFSVYPTPKSRLVEMITGKCQHKLHHSVIDVNFSVKRGEVFGIVGRNGAGKSTLLKLIAGTLSPTSGQLAVNGRVTAILELGNGFHPEFTGRENIYLGGLCMGMSRAEIERKIPEIIAFSELGDWIDRPFKTYSSGMQARLTFSTATSVEPDILIVDEALSVGDARFQLKSFGRIEAFRRQGRTILLVSHDHTTITNFCDRALLLDYGRALMVGPPLDVCNAYHKLLFGETTAASATPTPTPSPSAQPSSAQSFVTEAMDLVADSSGSATPEVAAHTQEYGTRQALIREYAIRDMRGQLALTLQAGESYKVYMKIEAQEDIPASTAGYVIRSSRGVDLFGQDTSWGQAQPLVPPMAAGDVVEVEATLQMNLSGGSYYLTCAFARMDGLKYHLLNNVLEFKVVGPRDIFTTSIVDLQATLSARITKKATSHVT